MTVNNLQQLLRTPTAIHTDRNVGLSYNRFFCLIRLSSYKKHSAKMATCKKKTVLRGVEFYGSVWRMSEDHQTITV